MIELKHVTKVFEAGDTRIHALDDVSVAFREQEFVSIVGESGSGKTTFLNVVGGLMQYDSGEFYIQGKSTADFSKTDWDAYRNNSVGFVFQSYHLIPHLTIQDNVEMGMTLSGIDASQRKKRAQELLERVGLKNHMKKKPNQLSGGQQQRVAIARALANDPDIILADEPTGALDSETSVEIMELLKEISHDKLIVMVTHSQSLADKYSDRIVRFDDGKIIDDNKPFDKASEVEKDYQLNPSGMSFWTALKLSWQNIKTKKGRTAITAIASSIGIIGVAAVLALSNGMNNSIEQFESDSMSSMPISVEQQTLSLTGIAQQTESLGADFENLEEFPKSKNLLTTDMFGNLSSLAEKNNISQDYVSYLQDINPDYLQALNISYGAPMRLLKEDSDNQVAEIEPSADSFKSYPTELNKDSTDYLQSQFDLLEGAWPEEDTDLLLVVNQYNQIDETILESLGLPKEDDMASSDVVGTNYQLVMNNDYFQKNDMGLYSMPSEEQLDDLYTADNNKTLKISGVIRPKETGNIEANLGFIYFDRSLQKDFIADAKESDIVQDQEDSDVNVMTGQPFAEENDQVDLSSMSPAANLPIGATGGNQEQDAEASAASLAALTKEDWMTFLGADDVPNKIEIFPTSFETKDDVLSYLDAWNEDHPEEEQVLYNDMASIITELAGGIISAITWILVAFAAISLVVSVIMMGIIVYSSVMERTGEIGILRALGARQKDITRVFNAETFIIGLLSGVLGIGVIYLISPIVNSFITGFSGVEGVFSLNPLHALGLIIVSLALTLFGGYIPARMASKMDPVEALSKD